MNLFNPAQSFPFSASRAPLGMCRSLRIRKRTLTVIILLGFSWLVGVLDNSGVAYLVLPPFLVIATALAFVSPAVIGSFLLYGWVVLPSMDVPPFAGLPRIPATSLVAAVILVALAIQRLIAGSVRQLFRPSVVFYVGLFALIFMLGYLGIYLHGKWDLVVVRILAWQKLISCASLFACGLLCCRNREDLSFIIRVIPVWFLIYLLNLPLEAYLDFARKLVTASSAYSVGLEFGLLNTNTLGQGACLAAIVPAALLIHSRLNARDRFIYGLFFMLIASVTLATASRQSILALLAGLFFLVMRLRIVTSILLPVTVLLGSSAILQRLRATAENQGFLARFVDIGKSGDEWSTGSFTERWQEFDSALPHLRDHPLIGYGFGGYSLDWNIPDVRSPSDLNNSNYLNDLWNNGYFLVGEHNFPLSLYLQTGLVGVVSFLILVAGPYICFRRQNRALPFSERRSGYLDDVIIVSLGAAIFVLQNISGGLALGSMSMLLFIAGALIGCLSMPRRYLGRKKLRA